MGAISHLAMGLKDSSKVNQSTYEKFLKYLVAEGYFALDGSSKLSVEYYDEKKDDEIWEDLELTDLKQADAFFAAHPLKTIKIQISEDSELGEALNEEAELCGEKYNEEYDSGDRFGAMYPGFGHEVDCHDGAELGWQFYVAVDGSLSDEGEDGLDEILMENTTHLKKIRKQMEVIFGTGTTVSCPITG